MDSERWKKLEDVYQVALPMNQSERSAYLNRCCAADEELQRDAETLLAFADPAGDFLEGNASTLVMEVFADEDIRRGEMRLLNVGEVLDGRYEILQEMRGGGMGSVYKAYDRRLGWMVVVKVIREHALKDRWMVDKFRQEKDALAKIDHPNVVRLVDAGELENGAPYLVMKYVEGSDLSQILAAAEGGLEPARVAAIMQQAGHGVSALHEAGLVHRDIKPGNFVVAEKDLKFPVKVIDLGIVRVLGTNTRLDQIPGTPGYFAPEQLSGEDVTTASDVYALGVTAYELLTGRPLFDLQGMPLKEIPMRLPRLQQNLIGLAPHELLPDFPNAAAVILKALSLDPADRQSAQEFGEELARALTLAPISTVIDERISLIRRFVNWLFLNKWRLTAALAMFIVLGVMLWGVSLLVKPNGTPPRPERSLTYGLTVVQERDGKTVSATGRGTFETGDEFRFNFTPAQAGALYVFNEGTSGNWHVLFPTPENHHGDPGLAALERIQTRENRFTVPRGMKQGTESIWIVWASQPVQALDEIVNQSVKNDLTVSNPLQHDALRQFMAAQVVALEDDTSKDQSQITLKGRDETLVYLLKLEHMQPR
jgi:serine/threonine protein kinase